MKYLVKYLGKIEPDIAAQLTGDCKELYTLIQEGEITSTAEATKHLYNGARQDKRFSELKIALIEQLTNIVLRHPWYYNTEIQNVSVKSWKALAAVKILITKSNRTGAIDIMLYNLQKARRYDLHRVCVEICFHLCYHFFAIERNERRGKYFEKVLLEEKVKAEAEEKVRLQSAKLFFGYDIHRIQKTSLKKEFRKQIEFFKPYYQHGSISINVYLWRLEIILAYMEHDYQKVRLICMSAIQLMEKRKMDRTAGFRFKLAPAQIILGQYDEARENIRQAIVRVKKEEYSWCVFTYYQLLIELHDGKYEQAFQLFQKANGVPQFGRTLNIQWRIVKAYMAFLIRSGYIQNHKGRSPHYKQIISEIPPYSQDKQGNNINILILQLIINLGHNNDVLIDRSEAIRKYMQRHMRSRELVRARTFLEMLLTIPKYQFHYEAVIRHTQKKQKLLESKPLRMTQNQDIEIIPYTELWKMVLGVLTK